MKSKGNNNKRVLLFVCTGNTCRSPMAEQIFAGYLKNEGLSSHYAVRSAGIAADNHDTINTLAVEALISLNIKPKKHRCRQITRLNAVKSDVIICMSKAHKDMILEQFSLSGNVFCFSEVTGACDVPDPYGSDIDKYISCANYLSYACEDILRLLERLETP